MHGRCRLVKMENRFSLGAVAVLIFLFGIGVVSSAGVTLPVWED